MQDETVARARPTLNSIDSLRHEKSKLNTPVILGVSQLTATHGLVRCQVNTLVYHSSRLNSIILTQLSPSLTIFHILKTNIYTQKVPDIYSKSHILNALFLTSDKNSVLKLLKLEAQ